MQEVMYLLEKSFDSMGGRIKPVPVEILSKVRDEWAKCLKQLENTDMYNELLKDCFNFSLPEEIKSLILIALPSPPCYVEAEWDSIKIEADIPPVYVHRDKQLSMIKDMVSNVFEQYQLKSYPVVLPKKKLAAMCGFGKYGRNNLLYIEGMGSCHRLTVFGSDMICTEDIEMTANLIMDRCGKCGSCIKQCPTGAIGRNSNKTDADKCLTFYNERNGEMPQWLHDDWHNCLVGCVRCQERCPENRGLWNRKKAGSLSAEETQKIIDNTPFELLDKDLRDKLKELCLDRYYNVLARNLMLYLKMKIR